MLRNFSKLFSANLVTGVIGLITLTLVSRGLGPNQYGLIAVVFSLGAFIEQIASFQAWQATTKYAADALSEDNSEKLWRVVSIGLGLDVVGSIAASLFGAFFVFAFSELVGISTETKTVSVVYMLSLCLNVSGTATSVLRLFERYNSISITLLCFAIFKFLGVVTLSFTTMSMVGVISFFIFVQVSQSLVFVYLMFKLSMREGGKILLFEVKPSSFREFPGMIRFVVSTNLSSTIRQLVHEFDVVLLSSLAGASAAGQYKLAKQYGAIVLRVVEPAQQVVFPRIATLVSEKNFFELSLLLRKLVVIGLVMAFCALSVFAISGEQIVLFILGDDYVLVTKFLGTYLVAISIFSSMFFLRPLVLSFGRADSILAIYVVGTTCFFLTFWFLYVPVGAVSMMYAQVVFYAIWAVGMVWTARRAWVFYKAA